MSAHDVGYVSAQASLSIGLLAGVWKCWSISRRPTTNGKCVLALMFLLMGFFVPGCMRILSSLGGSSRLPVWVTGLSGLIMIGLFVTALVLAILGLTEFSRKPGIFVQGRSQAIWTLVLIGLIGAFGLIGAISTSQSRGFAPGSGQARSAQTRTFDDLNFRFKAPDLGWVSFDASKLNKAAQVSYMRRFPEAYLLVIGERIGHAPDLTCEQLADIGKAHLQVATTSSRILSEAPLQINGINGWLVETEAVLGAQPFYYLQWYIATNGYAYQLIGYGRQQDRQQVKGELRTLFSRFELVEPTRVASSPGLSFTTNYTSAQYGYRVIVTNSPWHVFATLEKNLPSAEFGASRGESCFAVVPVWLGGEKFDFESLAAGLLQTMNIAYPNEQLINRKLLSEGGLSGVQYDFAREIGGGQFRYRFKILEGNGNAYLVTAWTQRRGPEAETLLADALGRVSFAAPTSVQSASSQFSARERKTQGFVLNQAGMFHSNSGEYEKALPLFRAAAEANNQESLYVLNALQAWRNLERPAEALKFLELRPASLRARPEVRALQASFQLAAGLSDQALTNYASVFASGYRNENRFTEYINLLNLHGQHDTALAKVESYLKAGDSIAARLQEAETYSEKGDVAKAIALLKAQREKAPFNPQIAGALSDATLQAGLYNEALEISRDMLKLNHDSAYWHYLKGRSELGLKWYRDAKASFEEACKLSPANQNFASYRDHVSALMGEGSSTAIKEPIEVVALPAALTNWASEPTPEGYAKTYGAYYTRQLVAVNWEPRKDYRTTYYMFAQVLDSSALASFSTMQIGFDPLNEQLFVNEVRVTDSSGNTVSTGKLADYYVVDDSLASSATQKKVLNIPVKGLQAGCSLAVTITRRELGPLQDFPFLDHCFSRPFPVRESILFLRGATKGLLFQTSPVIEPRKLPEGLCWRVADPLVARWEPQQAPGASYLPMLWIADASSQWPALASNYLALISDRLEPDAGLINQARTLVTGADNMEAKISLLTRYVQTNCTYKAIEFGRRARVPNKPVEILRNKYGDCKDHAVLLQQMLEAVNIPARLALANPLRRVQRALPSIDQFNHMIVWVPTSTGDRFIDATDKGADAAHAIPLGLAGSEALILDQKDPRFGAIPAYSENASSIDVQRELHLVDFSDVEVVEAVTLDGFHAAYMRTFLLQSAFASRKSAFQRQMGLADVELSDFKAEELDNPALPLRLRYSYTLKKQFHLSNDRLSGVLRAPIEKSYLAADPVDGRLSPFEVTIPFSLQTSILINTPSGFGAEQGTNPTLQLDRRFVQTDGQVHLEGSHIQFQCRTPPGKFKAPEYAAYRATMAQVLSLLEREVSFKAEPRLKK